MPPLSDGMETSGDSVSHGHDLSSTPRGAQFGCHKHLMKQGPVVCGEYRHSIYSQAEPCCRACSIGTQSLGGAQIAPKVAAERHPRTND